VAGAFGGSLDHELVNLAVAAAWSGRLRLRLLGRGGARLLGPGRHLLGLKRGERFSLVACGRPATVTLTGSRYPLARERLVPGSRGLGNRAHGRVSVRVHSGAVWFVGSEG
jgi:thiamine pyrophosphokinase